jgi:hypothetical protein
MNLRSSLLVLLHFFVPATIGVAETLDLRNGDDPAMSVQGAVLTIIAKPETNSIWIPRVYAALRSAAWQIDNAKSDQTPAVVTVNPEPEHWVVRWDSRPAGAEKIVLMFDTDVNFAQQNAPCQQLGDGRLNLHAYQATTAGEKLRYEPQPHKNTVGYWVNPNDQASWSIQVERGGTFNVGLLQGCGRGQGGSVATLVVSQNESTVAELEWEVVETGHFQNFVWRTVGTLTITEPGLYSVKVKPQKIAKAALMDVRQIQLVLLP